MILGYLFLSLNFSSKTCHPREDSGSRQANIAQTSLPRHRLFIIHDGENNSRLANVAQTRLGDPLFPFASPNLFPLRVVQTTNKWLKHGCGADGTLHVTPQSSLTH